MISPRFVQAFTHAALSRDPDLAVAALMIARLEHPRLDASPYLDQLDALGREARQRVARATISPGEGTRFRRRGTSRSCSSPSIRP